MTAIVAFPIAQLVIALEFGDPRAEGGLWGAVILTFIIHAIYVSGPAVVSLLVTALIWKALARLRRVGALADEVQA